MKIKFLLLGTSLSLAPHIVYAQCITPIQDCYALGYTQSSCPNGKGVKCPFGNGWYCGGTAAQDCIKLGYDKDCAGAGESGSGETCNGKYQSCTCDSSYQYTCSGTGYSGGSGSACGEKYVQCACASGYEWKSGSCQQQVLNGAHGDLYYCDGKVVAVKAPKMNFFVAMQDLGLMNWNNADSGCYSYSFCRNLRGALPTKDQLLTMYDNKLSLNSLLSTNGGTNLTEGFYWSSTSVDYRYYSVSTSLGAMRANTYDIALYVRPVLIP